MAMSVRLLLKTKQFNGVLVFAIIFLMAKFLIITFVLSKYGLLTFLLSFKQQDSNFIVE